MDVGVPKGSLDHFDKRMWVLRLVGENPRETQTGILSMAKERGIGSSPEWIKPALKDWLDTGAIRIQPNRISKRFEITYLGALLANNYFADSKIIVPDTEIDERINLHNEKSGKANNLIDQGSMIGGDATEVSMQFDEWMVEVNEFYRECKGHVPDEFYQKYIAREITNRREAIGAHRIRLRRIDQYFSGETNKLLEIQRRHESGE